MQEFFEKNKNAVIIATVVIVILVGAVIFMSSGSKSDTTNTTSNDEPTEAPIPTVDSSVHVAFNLKENNRKVDIDVTDAPKGTKTMDVELSYSTAENIEGAFGEAIPVVNGKATKEFVFGTASSGVYRYHVVTGDPKVTIKFNGSYGEQIFQKSYKMK